MDNKQSEDQKRFIATLEAENQEMAALVHKVFKQNSDGARYLELLEKRLIIDTPVIDFDNKSEKWMAFREGQNDIVRQLRRQIKIAELEGSKQKGA